MSRDTSYQAVMARKNEIMKSSMGLDYEVYRQGGIAFDYERMMSDCGFSLEDIIKIQAETKVGNTPMFELRNLTEAVRKISEPGKGARIFIKDEAANASGSFKARRAS
ncbi:MAG: PLP-dependent lyase/thiolase, partial [Candidatus Riflebacteria bacterium]|nr:PLP-dependent lyase/thiolase [Candidatus Riflebacteria bacterium]